MASVEAAFTVERDLKFTSTLPDAEGDGDTFSVNYHVFTPADGGSGLPVVCVHGLTRNSWDFEYLAAYLATRGKKVVTIDVVGRGGSDYLPAGKEVHYGYPLYCANAVALLVSIGHTNVHWVGTSMGGLIGMFVAGTPDAARQVEFASVTFNDIGPFVPKEALERLATYVGEPVSWSNLEEAEAALRKRFAPFKPITDEQWVEFTKASVTTISEEEAKSEPELGGKLRPCYDRRISHAFKRGEMKAAELLPFFEAMKAGPFLLLRGADSDILGADLAADMVRVEPTSEGKAVLAPGLSTKRKLVEFEDCGHAPPLLCDEQCEPIASWIAEVDSA